MITWMTGKDLIKHRCQRKSSFITICNGKNYRCWLQARLESLGKHWITKFWLYCLQTYSKVSETSILQFMIWILLIFIFYYFLSTWILMAGMFGENRNQTGITDRFWYATNGRKRHLGRSISFCKEVCKSQQQIHKRQWSKNRTLIPHVLRCQLSMWMGKFTKVACRWFRVGKE